MQRQETAIAAALQRAGYAPENDISYATVADIARSVNLDPIKTNDHLWALMRTDTDLRSLILTSITRPILANMKSGAEGAKYQLPAAASSRLPPNAPRPDRYAGNSEQDVQKDSMSSVACVPTRPDTREAKAARAAASLKGTEKVLTLLDTHKLLDGRAIGDLRWGEISALTARTLAESRLLAALQKHGTPTHQGQLVREVISAKTLARILNKLAE